MTTLFEMYDIEVYIPDKVSITELVKRKPRTLEDGREAEIVYNKKIVRISLTGVWDLAFEDFDTFLDELVGIILHEYLHYFFRVNGIPQNEELIERLSLDLLILSLGRLIGATNSKEDVKAYEEWVNIRFLLNKRKKMRHYRSTMRAYCVGANRKRML